MVAGTTATDDAAVPDVPQRSNSQSRQSKRDASRAKSPGESKLNEEIENKINDMLHVAKTEERVSRYLERMQQDHSSGRFQRIDGETTRSQKVTSWEQLHKTEAHNRHVYFGGSPLGVSIEVLTLKRREAQLMKETKSLKGDVKKRDEQIEELLKKQSTDFIKFEMALGKAVALGSGCTALSELIFRLTIKVSRTFFRKMRRKQYKALQSTIDAQSEILKQKRRLASMVIARHMKKMLLLPVIGALEHWRRMNTKGLQPSYNTFPEAIKPKKYSMPGPTVLHQTKLGALRSCKNEKDKHTDNLVSILEHSYIDTQASVEESLLTRLENLVAEEMHMLTTAKYVEF
ncbi:uncharacterized protein BXIN_2685 [Babesia sp. Xinjiang]|uniref:uncharacterized protein n=1 Tax=Babesia sp. Xinjiang TaxID=462227 RepID=UPI000A23DF01|nr:uncharacterized protein BXIN_2635 [Babesia sp. Xinjiang]XP_028872075.1 uncharacterized protein BXIN_2685 [Babesia sp. Xinjiang]ORM41604.1 hypothetical protein BXIN_2635 [Babesia sp. Xinjiang]ORM41619.1 hypothetical protein BXIN_2685 [Babesia sp. Xinjiang]